MLSLVWMALQARRHGAFGRLAGALLRSVYVVVVGLGGWFFGALIVLTALPGVPLDGQPLVVLSMSLPIGLGIYCAWIYRDWSAQMKTVACVASVGGAVVGGWLGFNATPGLVALATTIIGAAIAANLLLILLDISRERQEAVM